MIRASEQDVAEPRNLYEWELTEDMTFLPPSRPESEITPVSYLIAKGRILDVMGRIVGFMSSLKLWEYEDVLRLDAELVKVFKDQLPDFFRMPQEQGVGDDSPSVVNRRIQLTFLYHQGMCVLHRKFMAQGRNDERFSLSRERCLESAKALLAQQHFLWHGSEVEHTFASKSWYRVSYTSQEYILAAMIVVLELKQRRMESVRIDSDFVTEEEMEMFAALRRACDIWRDVKDSVEASRVYKVLEGMLAKVGPQKESLGSASGAQMSGFADSEAVFMPEEAMMDMDIDWCVSRLDVWFSLLADTCIGLLGTLLLKGLALRMSLGMHQCHRLSSKVLKSQQEQFSSMIL